MTTPHFKTIIPLGACLCCSEGAGRENDNCISLKPSKTSRYGHRCGSWSMEMWRMSGWKSMSGSDSAREDTMWGLNTPRTGEMKRERDDGRAYEYLISWWEWAGEVGRAVPEVLVMSGVVKIFTLNTALWDMSSGEGGGREGHEEEEERCEVLSSVFLSLSGCWLFFLLLPVR